MRWIHALVRAFWSIGIGRLNSCLISAYVGADVEESGMRVVGLIGKGGTSFGCAGVGTKR